MVEVSSPLRLTIWRSFASKRSILSHNLQNSESQVLDPENLQEEIYTWHAADAPFDGIEDEGVRRNLRVNFVDKLNASLPPSERGLDVLQDFIEIAEEAFKKNKTNWTLSQSTLESDEEHESQIDGLLAVMLHLKWLVKCFAGRPGIRECVIFR